MVALQYPLTMRSLLNLFQKRSQCSKTWILFGVLVFLVMHASASAEVDTQNTDNSDRDIPQKKTFFGKIFGVIAHPFFVTLCLVALAILCLFASQNFSAVEGIGNQPSTNMFFEVGGYCLIGMAAFTFAYGIPSTYLACCSRPSDDAEPPTGPSNTEQTGLLCGEKASGESTGWIAKFKANYGKCMILTFLLAVTILYAVLGGNDTFLKLGGNSVDETLKTMMKNMFYVSLASALTWFIFMSLGLESLENYLVKKQKEVSNRGSSEILKWAGLDNPESKNFRWGALLFLTVASITTLMSFFMGADQESLKLICKWIGITTTVAFSCMTLFWTLSKLYNNHVIATVQDAPTIKPQGENGDKQSRLGRNFLCALLFATIMCLVIALHIPPSEEHWLAVMYGLTIMGTIVTIYSLWMGHVGTGMLSPAYTTWKKSALGFGRYFCSKTPISGKARIFSVVGNLFWMILLVGVFACFTLSVIEIPSIVADANVSMELIRLAFGGGGLVLLGFVFLTTFGIKHFNQIPEKDLEADTNDGVDPASVLDTANRDHTGNNEEKTPALPVAEDPDHKFTSPDTLELDSATASRSEHETLKTIDATDPTAEQRARSSPDRGRPAANDADAAESIKQLSPDGVSRNSVASPGSRENSAQGSSMRRRLATLERIIAKIE